MAPVDPTRALPIWSGPIEELRDENERPHFEAAARPGIDIDEALHRGWFEIWYQPKVDLRRKCLAGAEALARIRHPSHGLMLPGSFLPDISEGSIARLTKHALIATLDNWTVFDAAGFNLHLAINVPVSVLLTLPIPDLVELHRPRSERWPGIILEVTEDEVVRDIEVARAVASQLRVAGIQIAIDDFGAGYSSLSCLRELPFSELKLNHGFVRSCATDATNSAICQTAIDLAHRFGSAAVAVGVESHFDLQTLIAMGCDFGQGAVIAPPMPQDDFLELLLRRLTRGRAQADQPLESIEAIDRVA